MNNASVIQIRLNSKLKSQAQEKAQALGYTSLQEIMRVFLRSFANGLVEPGIVSTTRAVRVEQFPSELVKLTSSAKKNWKTLFKKIEEDHKKGDFLVTDSKDAATRYLFKE